MKVVNTEIPEVLIFEPKLFGDHRGFFVETFQAERYASLGLTRPFVQDNLSRSAGGCCGVCTFKTPFRRESLSAFCADGWWMSQLMFALVARPSVDTSRLNLAIVIFVSFGFLEASLTGSLFFQSRQTFSISATTSIARPTNWSFDGMILRLELIGGSHKSGTFGPRCSSAATKRRGGPPVFWAGMMRVLLTGVTGQVGGALCAPLSKIGTVMAADRSILDLSSPDSIEPKLGAMAPDLIINAAAYTAVDDAEDERGLAYCINATAPGILARWASGHNVPIVHFSTDYVFDGSGHQPWR